MKELKLSSGETALVDDEDFLWLSEYRWHRHPCGYAHTTSNGISKTMQGLILNTARGMHAHHINGIKLDNQRANLISLPASEHSRLPRRLRSCARTRIVREITDGCNVGSYIAIARTSQNVSLCALAKKAGVSPGHLSLIETGQRIPLITTFISIALALQLSLDDLAYGFLSDDISPKLTIVDRS